MPLHTVEAPITPSLGPGDRQSLPPRNPPSGPSIRADRADDILLLATFTEFRSLDIDEQVKNAIAELADEYTRLVFHFYGFYGTSLEKRSRYMKATAEYLTVLAAMSLFLGAIQIIFIQFTAANMAGFSGIPAPASAAFNVFSFGALTLDVLGAVFALTSARTLFKTVNKANNACEAKFNISIVVWDTLDEIWKFYQVPGSDKDSDLASLWLPELGTTCRILKEGLLRLVYIMEHHLDANYGILTVITAGVVFFFVSLFIFMITTQRVVMWVPTVVLAALVMVWLLLEELHHNSDIWRDCLLYLGRRPEETNVTRQG